MGLGKILSPQLEKKSRLTDLLVSFEQNPNDFQSPAYLQFSKDLVGGDFPPLP
jgi:hypothetical protein